MINVFKAEKGFRLMAEEMKLVKGGHTMLSFAENCTVEELKALGIEAKPDYIKGGFRVSAFSKDYTVEELEALGFVVQGDPKEVPLFDPEELKEEREEKRVHTMSIFEKDHTIEEQRRLGVDVYEDEYPGDLKEAREEMGEDFIEMERIDDYIEPDYYHNGTDGVDTIEMLYRTVPFEQFRGFMKGNVIKYVTRYDRKNGQEDLVKAHTYLDRLRDYEEQHGFAKRLDEEGAELDKALDRLNSYRNLDTVKELLAQGKPEGEL